MRVLIKSLILTLALAGAVAAQDPAARGAEIIKQARQAIADEAKLSALKSISLQGSSRQVFGEREIQNEIELDILFPDKVRRSTTMTPFPGADMQRIEVINGDQVWTDTISSAPMPQGPGGGRGPGGGGRGMGPMGGMPGMDEATRLRLDLTRLLLGLLAMPAPGTNVEYKFIGEAKAPDGVADVVEVKGPGDQISRVFVDRNTHRVLVVSFRGKDFRQMAIGRGPGGGPGGRGGPGGMRQGGQPGGQPGAQPGGQPGGPPPDTTPEERERRRQQMQAQMQERFNALPDVDYFIRFSEYKSVNGLNLPHVIVRSIGDQINEEFAISKYKINSNIKPEKFVKKEKQ